MLPSNAGPTVMDGAIRLVTTGGSSKASSTGTGPGSRGGICRVRSSGRGRRRGSGIAAMPRTGPGTGSWPGLLAEADAAGQGRLAGLGGRHDRPCAPARDEHHPPRSGHRGLRSNHKEPARSRECEPAGHGIGRSRGGLTTKIHAAVDGQGRPLAAGHHRRAPQRRRPAARGAGRHRVPRLGRWPPAHPPGRGDRGQGVLGRHHTAERCTPAGSRSSSPRSPTRSPPANAAAAAAGGHARLDTDRPTAAATSSNAHFALTKQWRGLATRYDKLAITYRAAVILLAVLTWSRV